MKKSIDNIWENGFMKSGDLAIPKINKLYNTKTISTVNKLKTGFNQNIWIVLVISLMHAIGATVYANIYMGIFWLLFFTPVMILAKKQQKAMQSIDYTENSYTYIKAFNDWLQSCMNSFIKLYRFSYPLYIIGITISVYFTSFDGSTILGQIVIESQKNISIMGIPVIWIGLLFIALIASLSSIFSAQIYKADIRSMYGNLIDKLAQLVEEMEELRE